MSIFTAGVFTICLSKGWARFMAWNVGLIMMHESLKAQWKCRTLTSSYYRGAQAIIFGELPPCLCLAASTPRLLLHLQLDASAA